MRLRLMFIFAAVFAAALMMAGARSFAVEGPRVDIPSHPDVSGVPYPGEESINKDFIIGLKGPNDYCETLKVAAPDLREALIYAHNYCPTCNLQDLTNEYVRAEAPWEMMTPKAQAFCLAK